MKLRIKLKYGLKIKTSKISLIILNLFKKRETIYLRQTARDTDHDPRTIRKALNKLLKNHVLEKIQLDNKIIQYRICPALIIKS